MSLSTPARPAFRSGAPPVCQVSQNFWNVSWYAGPAEDGGVVDVFGLLKMSMNVLKSLSSFRSGEASAVLVDGMFLRLLASFTIALVSVVRYLMSSHAASGFLAVLEMPMTLPVT